MKELLILNVVGRRASFSSKMTFPHEARGVEGIIIESKTRLAETSTGTNTELVRTKLLIVSLTRVGTNLVVVK